MLIFRIANNTNYLISEENAQILDTLWKNHRGKQIKRNLLKQTVKSDLRADRAQHASFYKDGNKTEFFGSRYERKLKNRFKAIEIHGTTCFVCGFNFEEAYGEHGKDFIEVHHVKPLSTLEEATEIDPETDLVPVCSNCHRMLHRDRENVLKVEELKRMIRR